MCDWFETTKDMRAAAMCNYVPVMADNQSAGSTLPGCGATTKSNFEKFNKALMTHLAFVVSQVYGHDCRFATYASVKVAS